MKTIQTTVTVTPEGKATIQLPPEISPGEYEVAIVIDEKIKQKQESVTKERPPLDFPVIHVDSWPEDISLRREDMYNEWGR